MNQTLHQFLQAKEKRAYKIALLACGHHHDALDIVQESMLSLVKYYSDHSSEEWALLFNRILHNKINDWYRQQGVRHRLLDWWNNSRDDPSDQSYDDPIEQSEAIPAKSNPDKQVELLDDLERIEKALNQLPLRQCQAFLLRAWEGYSVKDTANLMECTQGSVKTHYSRATHKLRLMLKDGLSEGNYNES
ncbi:MAG: RNA polymerase sigma factor [Cellvibrionales bacterium]|nr:RNA polymerase sigma factor [Cellvibrionales bacterium]